MGYVETCNSIENVRKIKEELDAGIAETEKNIRDLVMRTRNLYATASGYSLQAINRLSTNGLDFTPDAILNDPADVEEYVNLCDEIDAKKVYLEELSRVIIKEVNFLSGNFRTIDLRSVQALAKKPK